MNKATRRELTDEERAECVRLKAVYEKRKAEARDKGDKLTQADVGDACGWKSGQSAVNQYFNGKVPLNVEAILKLSEILGFKPAEVSPRLAAEIARIAQAVPMASPPGDASNESNVRPGQRLPTADNHKEAAAFKVLEMLQRHGKGLSAAVRKQIADAVADSLGEPEPSAGPTANFSRVARVADGDILIPQYDVRAAMGHGQVPADYVEFVRNIIVSGPQLEKMGLDYTSPTNLSIITGWGQSMEGTINDKDPVVVDRGVNEFVGDGVYVITWLGLLYIKRLQMHDADHFKLISDNKQLDKQVARVDDVTIHAKVLLVWNAKKL